VSIAEIDQRVDDINIKKVEPPVANAVMESIENQYGMDE